MFETTPRVRAHGFPSTVTPSPRGCRSSIPRALSRANRDVLVLFVNEPRVEPQRDVVQEEPVVDAADVDADLAAGEGSQRAFRLVAIEAQVAREVVEGAGRDDDEGAAAFERDLGDRRQRAVAARDPERPFGRLPRDLARILALAQEVRLDSDPLRRRAAAHRPSRPGPTAG